MGAAFGPVSNLIRIPPGTSAIAAIQAVSIGLALIMTTVHGATENQLRLIRGEIGKETVQQADRMAL